MRVATILAVLPILGGLAACGGPSQPPHGPHYDPVNSPEAASPCPDAWKAAKEAREKLLGAGGAELQVLRGRAAAAVLSQAECEAAAFGRRRVEAGSQVAMAAELRAARRAYDGAANLYREVQGYGDARLRVGAYARLARLHIAMARLVGDVPAPVDVHTALGRAEVRRQMSQLMAGFQADAAVAATRALEAAAVLPPDAVARDRELGGWVRGACEELGVLDPDTARAMAACHGGAGGGG